MKAQRPVLRRTVTECVIVLTVRKCAMVGVPGSEKSTHSVMLARDFDLVRISVGDIFRWHARHHTKIGGRVRDMRRSAGLSMTLS